MPTLYLSNKKLKKITLPTLLPLSLLVDLNAVIGFSVRPLVVEARARKESAKIRNIRMKKKV